MRLEADSTALDGPCRIGPPAISAEPASSPSPRSRVVPAERCWPWSNVRKTLTVRAESRGGRGGRCRGDSRGRELPAL